MHIYWFLTTTSSEIKKGKAKYIQRTPFKIKLLYDTTECRQPLTLGIDMDLATIGRVRLLDANGNVAYMDEIEIYNDIADKW